VIEVAGKRVALSGPGKAHEQTQTRARFGPAFTYAMLWGPSASLVALLTGGRSFGSFEAADGDRAVETFAIGPWAHERPFSVGLSAGRELYRIGAHRPQIRIPIFAKMWNGHIVAADVGGRRMVGRVNDWRGGS
jgi:hypothetical protein